MIKKWLFHKEKGRPINTHIKARLVSSQQTGGYAIFHWAVSRLPGASRPALIKGNVRPPNLIFIVLLQHEGQLARQRAKRPLRSVYENNEKRKCFV